MLKHLVVLAVLYQDKIVGGEDDNLESLVSVDFSFLEEISDICPTKLAKLVTGRDEDYFRQFCAEDFHPNSKKLRELTLRFSRLGDYVKACSIADNGLIKPIIEVVKVS